MVLSYIKCVRATLSLLAPFSSNNQCVRAKSSLQGSLQYRSLNCYFGGVPPLAYTRQSESSQRRGSLEYALDGEWGRKGVPSGSTHASGGPFVESGGPSWGITLRRGSLQQKPARRGVANVAGWQKVSCLDSRTFFAQHVHLVTIALHT